MFDTKSEVDPISHLIGTAVVWGGSPPSAAVYEGITPTLNDGKTAYKLTVKDVPVDGTNWWFRHSERRASMGLMEAARKAGTEAAAMVTTVSVATTAVSVSGSWAETP